MQEEQDTCRICAGPAEPDQPLFYPCKCSGTIRYIHQDCLTTWLAHSKKKTCDVCKYPYSFTKVYAQDMPKRLPSWLLVRQVVRQLFSSVIFGIRGLFVGALWLGLLPWTTIWTWRLYFAMGDSIAWIVADLPRTAPSELELFRFFTLNTSTPLTANMTSDNADATAPSLTTQTILSHPVIRAISADIVSGQIIACMIVLAFVCIFLLREWITQNARPAIFEDDQPQEGPREDAPAPLPEEEPRPPRRRLRHDWVHDQARNVREQAAAQEEALWDARNAIERINAGNRQPGNAEDDPELRRRRLEPRERGRAPEDTSTDESVASPFGNAGDETPSPVQQQKQRQEAPPSSLPQTEFTFRVGGSDATSTSTTAAGPSTATNVPSEHALEVLREPRPLFGWDLEDPLGRPRAMWLPMEPSSSNTSTSANSQETETPEPSTREGKRRLDADETDLRRLHRPMFRSMPLDTPKRPPLPTSTLPPSYGPGSPPGSINRSRKSTPLASPSLASYHPPEELEAGPSTVRDYFSEEQLLVDSSPDIPEDDEDPDAEAEEEDMEAEHARYWALEGDEDGDEDVDAEVGDVDGEDEAIDHWSDHELPDDEEDEEREAQLEVADAVVEDAAAPRQEAAPPQPDPLNDAQLARLNDELDADNDMDGFMEAIGFRGPLLAVLQNITTVIVMLDATIGLGVWVPFTIGKSTALLTLNPSRIAYLLHLPIRIIRLVTDPVVDLAMFLVKETLIPWLSGIVSSAFERVLGTSTLEPSPDHSASLLSYGKKLIQYSGDIALGLRNAVVARQEVPTPTTEASSSFFTSLFAENSKTMGFIKPVFAPIGRVVRTEVTETRDFWHGIATGTGSYEKLVAVSLGYAMVGLAVALYLNVLTFGSMRSAGRALRGAVRQQLLVVKVAAFIVVELIIFPLGCGIMLDLSALYLLPNGTLKDRFAFLRLAPVTSTFYHWVIGTMFMYHFAVLLAGCRALMRSGAMWFIKDPQDQNFHPIRDILERPTLVQLKKLGISALMYAFVVAASVGTISAVLRLFYGMVLPFRWRVREPLSDVPVDLLFLQVVLPYTIHYFRPKKALRQFGEYLWKYLARQLRLTSYMFGGRHPEEESTPANTFWTTLFVEPGDPRMGDAEAVRDGTFRRVPNSDNIVPVKDVPATAEVDETGKPINDEQAKRIEVQNKEALKAKRNLRDDYTVVYIPPKFSYRVVAFICCVWAIGSAMLALTIALPLLLGRGVFGLFVQREVHDGYSFLVGFYLLWFCYLVAHAIDRLDKRRQRRGGDEPRAEWPLYVLKRSLLWIAKVTYMAFFAGFVVPTLVALVVEFYMMQPIRQMVNPTREVRVRIVDMWGIGLLLMKIFLRVLRPNPESRIISGIERIRRNGWTHPDPARATTEVILPVTAGLLGVLLLPAGFLWVLRKIAALPIGDNFLFAHLYPTIFTAAGLSHGVMLMSKGLSSWTQGIRDKEFLVEMRLQNLDMPPEGRSQKEGRKEKVD